MSTPATTTSGDPDSGAGLVRGRVVVGVGEGHAHDAALELAAIEASRRGWDVHLVLVEGPRWAEGAAVADVQQTLSHLERVEAGMLEQSLTRVRAWLGQEWRVTGERVSGGVARGLLACAADPGLIVLQHHRQGHLAHLPTPSTTNAVAARAPVPVVSVPDGWRESQVRPRSVDPADGSAARLAASHPGQEVPEHRDEVVAAVRDVGSAVGVVRAACEEAAALGSSCRVVTVWRWEGDQEEDPPPELRGLGQVDRTAAVRRRAEAALREVVRPEWGAVPAVTDASPHPPHPWARVRETHSGVVLLLGDRAWKVKKPVDLGFLDFTTLAARREACDREVALNRRLAVFHASADPVREGPAAVTRSSLQALWDSGHDTVAAHVPALVAPAAHEALTAHVRAFLDGRQPLLDQRRAAGAVVDGHGDLIADDVFCLADGPRILDCLDFDDRLRVLDRVDDAAFLAMDLEHLGRRDLAEEFVQDYLELSGDPAPVGLLHHYVAYRAYVRAKVSCLRWDQGEAHVAGEVRALHDLALDHLERGEVVLVVVGGAPATGKSTLAAGLADRLGTSLVATDRVRKELAGLAPLESAAAPLGEGIYTAERTRQVDAEVARRAAALLGAGESVVLDGTWSTEARRALLRRTARAASARVVEVRCVAPSDVLDARLAGRRRVSAAGTASDASPEVGRALRGAFQDWPRALVVETTGAPAAAVDQVVARVRPRGPRSAGRRSMVAPG